MHYVIIGNSAAAIGGVEGIRKNDSANPITLISDEPFHTYSRPLISYYLAGKVSEEKMRFRNLDFYERNGVTTKFGFKVVKVNPAAKEVVLTDGEKISYDKLLIASGGTPIVPPMEGIDKKNVFGFIKIEDVKAIEKVVSPGKKAVVIGAGLIGLKAAEALVRRGVETIVVELASRVLPAILDDDAADIVQSRMEREGVVFELGTSVKGILGEEAAQGAVLQNGKKIVADMVIVAVGVKPNTSLVAASGIEVNRGILVNQHCQTNLNDIYAAGDITEGFDLIHGEKRVLPIWPNAYRQGETAGSNMAGKVTTFDGGFAMNSIGFFGLPMITAGIINPEEAQCEVLVRANPGEESYRKVVLKGNLVVGFILLKKVDRAGILTSLISEQIDISDVKTSFLEEDFGYIHLPESLRHGRLGKGV